MNVEFYDSHLETLCELKNIAKKHGYAISFGVASSNDEMVEKELFQENGFTDEEIEAIDTILETTNHTYSDEKIWFQLSNKNEVNQLIYCVNSNYVTIKKDFETFTSEELKDIGVDEDELIQKLDNYDEFLHQLDIARMVIVFAASGIVRDVIDGLGQVMKVGMVALEKQRAVDVENGLRTQVF